MAVSLAAGNGESILGSSLEDWKEQGAGHTALEIWQQPGLWEETWQTVNDQQEPLSRFLNEAFAEQDLEIILTGAGSSAFIGEILAGPLQRQTQKHAAAISTTHLLTHPQNYFNSDKATLLISFARSGDSPESVATVHLARRYCRKVYNLIITCSASGKLARDNNDHSTYVLLLPARSNDQGLAMTGSFTCMLLAGLLISRIEKVPQLKEDIARLSRYGHTILEKYSAPLRELSALQFDRAVFLGSGPLFGTAMESHLKLQELTDGIIICKYDSYLGFRHGPKVVITPNTLLIYLFTNDQYAHQYEIDLIKSIHTHVKGLRRIGVMEKAGNSKSYIDLEIVLSDDAEKLDEDFLSICSVLPAQLLSLFKSIALGIRPDKPSPDGTITRVVEGVTIYPLPQPDDAKINTTVS